MARQTIYVAMTTQNAGMTGWHIVMIGEKGQSRELVEAEACRRIAGNQLDGPKDIYVDTELKNLRVLAESHVSQRMIDLFVDQDGDGAYANA